MIVVVCERPTRVVHAYARLGLTREELDCVLETFPVVWRKDEKRWGAYRAKWMTLGHCAELEGAFD